MMINKMCKIMDRKIRTSMEIKTELVKKESAAKEFETLLKKI